MQIDKNLVQGKIDIIENDVENFIKEILDFIKVQELKKNKIKNL